MTRRGPQGPHTFRRRWERERSRSPEIASVPVGGTVQARYNDRVYTARCGEGSWTCDLGAGPAEFATLYMVASAITGEFERPRSDGGLKFHSNWSAARFFGLTNDP